jgi:signal peptidase II
MLKKYIKDYAFLLSIAAIIILLDQLTKYFVRTNIHVGNVFLPDLWISQYARIVNVKNTGAAFGMFQSLGGVFTILSFIVSLVILYYFPRVPAEDILLRLAMGMLLGGAVGNLIDRLIQGHVTDFISIWIFPVFNMADLSITTGVIILFLDMWWQERHKFSHTDSTSDEEVNAPQQRTTPSLPED